MAMSPSDLAKAIHDALGEDGDPSDEVKGMAEAIIGEITTMGMVSFLPQTISGTCPPGGPLSAGAGQLGLLLGPSGPTLAVQMAAKMKKPGPTPQLIGMATGITTHLLTAQVSFSPGGISGTCANSPVSPGPFIGTGTGGKISGMAGDGMASLVAAGLGQSANDKVKKKCAAIVDFIQQNAEVMFAMGTVLGTAPPGGGPLIAGTAIGGRVS